VLDHENLKIKMSQNNYYPLSMIYEKGLKISNV